MMSQRWGLDRNVLWHLENPRVWKNTTEIPEQKKTISLTPNDLQLWDFSKLLKNESETVVLNELSMFDPLKFYCNWCEWVNFKGVYLSLLFCFVSLFYQHMLSCKFLKESLVHGSKQEVQKSFPFF